MKLPSRLCNLKRIIRYFVIIFAIVGVFALHILKENAELKTLTKGSRPLTLRPHLILSGHNCTLEAGVMNVKTTEIWDSRVVKVM